MNACRDCKWLLREQESWEMPHIWWWECTERPAMANLRSFPFKSTKCKSFERDDRPAKSGFILALEDE